MRRLVAVGLTVAAAGGATACASDVTIDAPEAELIARTRDTRATYSLILWNRIQRPGERPVEEWSAEFHAGTHHRVETPRDRVVADCAAMTGTHLEVATGKRIDGPQVARAACGIQANTAIVSARIVGKRTTRFGLAARLVVTDAGHVRTYDVAHDGALLAATISDHDGNRLLTNWATSHTRQVSGDIFSQESLTRSVVPDDYKKAPAEEPAGR